MCKSVFNEIMGRRKREAEENEIGKNKLVRGSGTLRNPRRDPKRDHKRPEETLRDPKRYIRDPQRP